MNHEAYICYDDKDRLTADAICHVLEENNIKCWLKSRDVGVNDLIDEVTEAINQSKLMILIFSNNAKNSNFVNTEVDFAFSKEKPILVFKIDESELDGGLEFFLNNKHWLDAYPNPKKEFRNLIIDSSKLLGNPIANPIISKTDIDKNFTIKKPKILKKIGNLKNNKRLILILIAIIYIGALAVIASNYSGYGSLDSENDITLVLSNSSYIQVPNNQFIATSVNEDGIFSYTDRENDINITCYDKVLSDDATKLNEILHSIKTNSEIIKEDDLILYETDGIYSIIVENNDYESSVLIQSSDKDNLIECWHSLTFHQ